MRVDQVIEKFVEGETSGKSSSVFIEGNTLYSFGKHFPLAVRTKKGFIVNTESRSITTSKHQNILLRAIPKMQLLKTVETHEIKRLV